ncbi:hypothetical protein [Mycolicibacterium tusciae]|uniref:Restriction endonuclease type IV Mrr domain-containing protein n=1 Tax=Mycolicibacterium tusciae TaxID=75922 RepID=A0A1X0K1U0_9MYCO|nr:hypothetical protein [Mycolicibacterium tusciae]ORB68795.1 hypothetical protein BST47_02595 [Mycolicibacterium tusciae]
MEWTRQSGEAVEVVVGMLLCSQHPNAVRIRPSQGDAGIDIFIPGPSGWGREREVWQVKRYCRNLTGTEKRAIKRSFAKVVTASNKEDWRIMKWHLVMPLDLTTQNLGWLNTYIADACVDFPYETHGLLLCDTLAANYPKVIDYYLRDGKGRLQAQMDNLTKILSGRLDRQENEPLMPADVVSDLGAIHKALNACDPFYKYNFDVSDKPPPDEPSPDDEGLVAAWAMCQDSVWVTIKIYALSLAALEERPITWRLQLAVPAFDDELRTQVQKFIDYGGPLSMPAGTVSGFLDLPAGLGGDLSGSSLQVVNVVEQSVNDEETELAIAMLAPDSDTVIAKTTIKQTEFSRGQGGARSIWVDNAELFTIEMLARDADRRQLSWNFNVEYNLDGRRPADIVDSLKFLAAMHAPNRIGIGSTYGPEEFSSGGLAPSSDRDREAGRWAAVADALARIQDHVAVLLRMPAEMTGNQSVAILEAAKLLAGETRTGAMTGNFTVVRQQTQIEPQLDTVYEFVAIKALKITLGNDEIPVGKEALFFRGMYTEIGDEEFTIGPMAEGTSGRYTGDIDAGRVFARVAPAIADDESPR